MNELLLAGHSPTYWAGWQNGKGDGKGGTFDVGGQLPDNSSLSQQKIWYAGYYAGYDKYCIKGGNNDNCPAIHQDGMSLIPSQDESLAYNLGFSDGFTFTREKVPSPQAQAQANHYKTGDVQNYTRGYEKGSLMYQEIRGAIMPGYLNQSMQRPPASLDKNDTADYISWYQQAKHFHVDDDFNITIPSHSNDNYFMYIIGIQDGMLVYDQDNKRENGDSPCPLGHANEKEYCTGFLDGGNIEHQAEDAD